MSSEKPFSIAFIIDERISNEKSGVLTRALSLVRQNFAVDLIKGHDINEDLLLKKMEQEKYQLVLAPLHRYQAWSRVEGFLGINRTSGPTLAGYFCEPVSLFHLGAPTSQSRRIILDFLTLSPQEILLLIRSLVLDTQRSGLKPLLEPNTPIYCESWYGNQGQGSRTDYVLSIPEIQKTDWIKRSSAIRIILSSLWGLVYEEGPGRIDTVAGTGGNIAKAYFQLSASPQCLLFRLYYYTVPHQTPKDALKMFWPDKTSPTKPSQFLLNYADFLRIHTIHETSDIEVVAGLLPSASAETTPGQAHTLWIEPISARLVSEHAHEAPGPNAPYLRALPSVSLANPKPRIVAGYQGNPGAQNPDSDTPNTRMIQEASARIKELKNKVDEREETIRELRSGGIGTAAPLPPPDAEGLLEAFQQKYFEARFQIRQFEIQLHDMQKKGASAHDMHELRLKMAALANREKAWIKSIMKTLDDYRQANKRPNKK